MKTLDTRIAKLERFRIPRSPYVIRVNDPMTAEDHTAIRSAGRAVAVLPRKYVSVAEWAARYQPKVCNE